MPIFRIMFLMALLAFAVLWIRIEINRSGREIGRLQNEVEVKEARNQYINLEILQLSSPEAVSRQVREKFGFEPVKPHHVIVLDK